MIKADFYIKKYELHTIMSEYYIIHEGLCYVTLINFRNSIFIFYIFYKENLCYLGYLFLYKMLKKLNWILKKEFKNI